MSKKTIQEFIEQKIAVTFNSENIEKERELFLSLCAKNNILWVNGDNPHNRFALDQLKNDSAIEYSSDNDQMRDGLMYGREEYFVDEGYKLVPAVNFIDNEVMK